jgi:SAM-dependent methyltransferase
MATPLPGRAGPTPRRRELTARLEPFDSFWEGPEDVDQGYRTFGQFYRANYSRHLPEDRGANILIVSCGPGYFVNVLGELGYTNVLGIDSDPAKVSHGAERGLRCRVGTAFEELEDAEVPFDAVICEQELNHLTKQEMVEFLRLVLEKLRPGGRIICHGLNGANPIVGAETLAQNFDHFNTFTDYSLRQALECGGFEGIRTFGLHLYVFYRNPFNYVAWAASACLSLAFRALFLLYGKSNRTFTKKIGAVGFKRASP